MAANKIPVTVITGFLGAGKTSLIRHLVTHAGERRLALLIVLVRDVDVGVVHELSDSLVRILQYPLLLTV